MKPFRERRDPTPLEAAEAVSLLVVDDREEDRLALGSLLAKKDCNVVLAASGREALKCVLERDFALILLDVMMPGMDGFEVASVIKQRDRSRHTPIVFLTAEGTNVDFIYKGYSVGAVDYLSKPLDHDVVRAKVDIFVELFRKDRRIARQSAALREAAERERERQLLELRLASERRYRNLAEAIPQIVWTASGDGVVSYCNRRWVDYAGAPRKLWLDAVHPDDLARCEKSWQSALASGEPWKEQCRLRRADGVYRWHLGQAVPEHDGTDRVSAWLGTWSDVDELLRAQAITESARRHSEILAEASALLSALVDTPATLEAIAHRVVPETAEWVMLDVIADPLARPVVLSAPLAIVHRDPVGEERLRELRTRFPPHPDAACWTARVAREGHTEKWPLIGEEEQGRIAADPVERALFVELATTSALVVPFRARDLVLGVLTVGRTGDAPAFDDAALAFFEDLAHRIGMGLDNARLYLGAQQAISARDDFLSIASHELRTPLTALQLQLQSTQRLLSDAKETITNERIPGKLDSAVRQTSRLEKLIENLLEVSRITTGRLALDVEQVDAAELVREVVGRMGDEAARAGCTLEVHADEAAIGTWDRARVDQIVTNLFSNAIKYAAGKPIEIRVDPAQDGHDAMRLTVRDQGIGIAPENVDRIFGRFERAVSTKNYGGLGMGLYITRQIVEAHGGSIHVDSEPGVGSTFTVELPPHPPTAH